MTNKNDRVQLMVKRLVSQIDALNDDRARYARGLADVEPILAKAVEDSLSVTTVELACAHTVVKIFLRELTAASPEGGQ